jgi:hypothetical protein
MNSDLLISALDLPADSRVDQRVPKKLLLEHGAPTAADKRLITDGIEEFYWIATLKPATVGVPVFRERTRVYLEIAVLSVALRAGAKAGRLAELIHRAVPYPVLLVATHGDRLMLSMVHKRWSQGEAGATVLDGDLVAVELPGEPEELSRAFLESLSIGQQPRTNLFALYQGWMERLVALLAARVTGVFALGGAPNRWEALRECERLDAEIARLRAAAAKERQMARQVELNLELKRLERQRSSLIQRL